MTVQNHAAQVAVQAEHCLKHAPVRWIPVLMLEGPDLEPSISTSFYERLPGSFGTSGEAMQAAEAAARHRPEALGFSVKRLEVSHAA